MFWMLQTEPSKRPTAKEVLSLRWFNCDQQVLSNLLVVNDMICGGEKISQDGAPVDTFSSFIFAGSYFNPRYKGESQLPVPKRMRD